MKKNCASFIRQFVPSANSDMQDGLIKLLHFSYCKKKTDPVAVTNFFLQRINFLNPKIKAFVSVCEDRARKEAAFSHERYNKGKQFGILDGIPYAVKDNLATAGVKTTANSRSLENWISTFDCPAIKTLHEAGAILLGKMTMNELGYGGYDLYPIARCPWNLKTCSGGSSSGSAAAVSASMCVFTLGTDGGGSIRVPGAICGVSGLAGTPGRIDGSGKLGHYRFDRMRRIGPLAIRIIDVEKVFTVLAKTVENSVDMEKIRFGWLQTPEEIIPMHPDITKVFEQTIELIKTRLHCKIKKVFVEDFSKAEEMNWRLLAHQAARRFSDILANPKDYTKDIVSLIQRGMAITDLELKKTFYFRDKFKQLMKNLFEEIDILLTPTMPVLLTTPGEIKLGKEQNRFGFFTAPMNLAGLPSLSVPAGLSRYGTPIGMQFTGPAGSDEQLLKSARTFQEAGGGAEVINYMPV